MKVLTSRLSGLCFLVSVERSEVVGVLALFCLLKAFSSSPPPFF